MISNELIDEEFKAHLNGNRSLVFRNKDNLKQRIRKYISRFDPQGAHSEVHDDERNPTSSKSIQTESK